MTIQSWLRDTEKNLNLAGITSARLDCLIMLSDLFKCDKAWILASLDTDLTVNQQSTLNEWIKRRMQLEPLAYIRGFIEFYGRNFIVSPSVMIPRPETEVLVESALDLGLPDDANVIDIGTGSGCIATTLQLERPGWHVTATDISKKALEVASKNTEALGAEIKFIKSNLLSYFPSPNPQPPNLITANLPYVARNYEVTPETRKEPELALFADSDGYELIEKLLPQAAKALSKNGYLMLESDPWQQERIIQSGYKYSFSVVKRELFHLVLKLT